MTILFTSASYVFTDHLPGGEYQVAHAIISGLAARGHRIHLIVPRADLRHSIPNVSLHELGGYDFVRRESYFAYRWNWWTFTFRAYAKAKRILREHPIDIAHHLRPAFPEKFSLCWRLKIPFVYGPVSLPMTASLPEGIAIPGEQSGTLRERLKNKAIDRLNFTAGRYLWRKMLETAASAPVSVPPTRDHLPACCRDKSPIIPLGVDPDAFTPGELPHRAPDILYAGHLVPAKGVEYLIRALPGVHRAVPGARLILAGDGPDRPRLERIASDLNLSRAIEFLGPVPFTEMPGIFQRCALFCLPTLAEAFGISILQAMACGKPVVASAVGGIPHIGPMGRLVPPRDPQALSDALTALLTDPPAMDAMGRHNRQLVLERYAWPAVIDQIEALYRHILSNAA